MRCTTTNYDLIYSPWMKDPDTLLSLAEYDPVKHSLLDLCGGTGAVAHTALTQRYDATGAYAGPPVVLMDLNPRQQDWIRAAHIKESQHDLNVGPWPLRLEVPFDKVICRQALGYIRSLDDFFFRVFLYVSPTSCFVFNTFSQPPILRRKNFEYGGYTYREFGVFLFGRILHVQEVSLPRENGSTQRLRDVSFFRYHSKAKIERALRLHWDFEVRVKGKSLQYICHPKTAGN